MILGDILFNLKTVADEISIFFDTIIEFLHVPYRIFQIIYRDYYQLLIIVIILIIIFSCVYWCFNKNKN